MTYGEVVTMFPMTRAVFVEKGIVEKPNFYYVPLTCFVEATFLEILRKYPRVRGVFEAYGVYETDPIRLLYEIKGDING